MKTISMKTAVSKALLSQSRMLSVCVLAIMFCVTYTSSLHGQAVYVEDGLRYAQVNSLITPRAGALGFAYAGIADDYAALYVNPAGLTMLSLAEFSASAQFNIYNSTATHFGTATSVGRTSPFLGHVGIALPIRVGDAGNYTIAFGYSRESDFSGGDSVVGFNTSSSLINSWVSGQNSATLNGNAAWELALADVVNGRFITPLRNNLQQNVSIRERGATNNLSIGLGVDVTKNFSLGLSFVGTFGEYSYRRVFQESDVQNRYKTLDTKNLTDIDFQRLQAVEFVDHTIGGSRLIAGAQMRFGDNIRAGVSFTLPLDYRITEQTSNSNVAFFDQGDPFFYNPNDPAAQTIRFTLPWSLNAGVSAHVAGITFTGSAEVSDLTSIRASGTALDATAIQQAATTLLTMQIRAGVGAEYDIPNMPLVVRGSYSYSSSPYLKPETGGVASIIGIGGGLYVTSNSRFDAVYRLSLRTYNNLLYSGTSYTSSQALSQIAIQYTVRF
jgi:hypothetical protein